MSCFAWFSSPDDLESVTFWFDAAGALIEFGVAITAAIIVHKEFGKEREKLLERYVAIFAGTAAFMVLSTALLNHRVSLLRDRESKDEKKRHDSEMIESSNRWVSSDLKVQELRSNNLTLETQIEQAKPENQPIATISAFARIFVKGDSVLRKVKFDDHWWAGISFFAGTNEMFRLLANHSDVKKGYFSDSDMDEHRLVAQFMDMYEITFHDSPAHFEYGVEGSTNTAHSFGAVGSLGLVIDSWETRQGETNLEVLKGTVAVTLNSTLTSEFLIPRQKQKDGIITSQRTTNSENQIGYKVWEIPVRVLKYDDSTNFFDGR